LDTGLESSGLGFDEETEGYGVLDHALYDVKGEIYTFRNFWV
jgi:hypothetical protein